MGCLAFKKFHCKLVSNYTFHNFVLSEFMNQNTTGQNSDMSESLQGKLSGLLWFCFTVSGV